MATYYVNSGAGGTNAGTSWTNAYTSIVSALTAATANGDIILVHYTHQQNFGAVDTTLTAGADISIVSVDKDSSNAPTAQGVNGWVGDDNDSLHLAIGGPDKQAYIYGVTLRIGATTSKELRLAASAGLEVVYDNCYFWCGTTNGAGMIALTNSFEANASFVDCTFRFGNVSQRLVCSSQAKLLRCSISSAGSAINTGLIAPNGSTRCAVSFIGCDLSYAATTVVPNVGNYSEFVFDRCTFASAITLFASQTTNPTSASACAFFSDCLVGTSRVWGHYNALGSTIREPSIYYTTNATGNESWKIVTTANVAFGDPYETPWVDLYNTGTSAITPRFEILRDGSATKYTDAQVWAEFSYKNTASSPLGSGLASDRQALSAYIAGTTASDQTAGTDTWDGENATHASMKCDSGSAITPTEAGYIRGRICVAAASITLYVDPQVRT